ncbi:hypothetical protein K1719_046238 [Acacia pycnantha]|nr:hypothetical protein K1719_046238 [Acacia pycnantha]
MYDMFDDAEKWEGFIETAGRALLFPPFIGFLHGVENMSPEEQRKTGCTFGDVGRAAYELQIKKRTHIEWVNLFVFEGSTFIWSSYNLCQRELLFFTESNVFLS